MCHDFAISRPDGPEVCSEFPYPPIRGRREHRVHAAPAVSCAKVHKKSTRAYRFSGGNPAFPAQWFYGLFRALPGEPSSFATVTSQISPQSLAPASGARTTRLRRPLESRSSVATFASTASHRTFVTTRDPPLSSGETGGAIEMICPTGEAKYFCKRGWTRGSVNCPSGKSVTLASAISIDAKAVFQPAGNSVLMSDARNDDVRSTIDNRHREAACYGRLCAMNGRCLNCRTRAVADRHHREAGSTAIACLAHLPGSAWS